MEPTPAPAPPVAPADPTPPPAPPPPVPPAQTAFPAAKKGWFEGIDPVDIAAGILFVTAMFYIISYYRKRIKYAQEQEPEIAQRLGVMEGKMKQVTGG